MLLLQGLQKREGEGKAHTHLKSVSIDLVIRVDKAMPFSRNAYSSL